MRETRIRIISILFLSIMLLGIVPQAVWAGQVIDHETSDKIFPEPFNGYDLGTVYIFYDSTDEVMRAVAEGVHEIASYRLNNVILVPISSAEDLAFWLYDEPWIAVYAFQSNLQGIQFADRMMPWSEFYGVLHEHKSTQHIVGMGNTLSLESLRTGDESWIHTSESEQTDGLLLILYDVYAMSQMCQMRAETDEDYAGAAQDLKDMALKMYADNFDEFFKRTVEPVNPVGEIDPVKAEERKTAMWARHPGHAEPAAYKLQEDGSLEKLDPDNLPANFTPAIALTTPADVDPGDFILGLLPLNSGLRGPVGKVVDVLLDVLMSAGSSVLSIPEDAIDTLMGTMEQIMDLIGIVKDFDSSSPIKSIIEAVADQFPFPADLKPYITPILKALFNLRGDLSSITSVLGELISGLLPAIIPSEVMDFLDNVLNIGDDLWTMISDVVSGGKGVFDTILSFMTNNVLQALLNKTLVATLGITSNQATNLVDRGITFIRAVVDYLSSFDFSKFLEDVGDELLNTALNVLTDTAGQEVIDKIMSVVKIGMSALDLMDQFDVESVMSLAGQIVEEFAGSSNIIGEAEDLARQLMNVTKIFAEEGLSSVTEFKSQLETILLANLQSSVPASTRTLIEDTITLIAGIYNDGFDPAQLPNIFDIAEALVQQLGLDTSEFNTVMEAINGAVKPLLGIIATVTNSGGLKQLIAQTEDNFVSQLGSLPDMIVSVIKMLDQEGVLSGIGNVDEVLNTLGQIANGIFNMIGMVRGQSFQGIMQSLLMSVSSIVAIYPSFDGVPIDAFLKLLQSFFPSTFGLTGDAIPKASEVIQEILSFAAGKLSGIFDTSLLTDMLNFLFNIKGIFTDGIQWILGIVYDWLTGQITPLLQQLETSINSALNSFSDLLGYAGNIPIGLGEWSLFELNFDLGIVANFHLNPDPFFDFLKAIIFEGRNPFALSSLGDFFHVVMSFFEIAPQFHAELGMSGFDSSKNPFMEFLLSSLGLELTFSGSAKFVLNIFTFRNGMFEWNDFFKLVEWGLSLKVAIQRTLTLLDFITGGVGGGVLGKLASYIGLDSINVKIWFGLELDIVKKAATAIAAEVSTLSLILTIGASLSIGIDIIVASVSLMGSLEIIFSFYQDLASSSPMKITLRLILTLKLKITFLWSTWKKTWTWEPGGPWDLSPSPGDEEYKKSGMGFDTDGDGLSDEYEATIPGLDPTKPDTDNDGASDKLEVQTMGTDPVVPDTDGDGLLDGEEWDLGTNPMRIDSDFDGLNDSAEVKIYGTDPLTQDTDGDGLTDYYEVTTSWNMTGITPTVEYVVIGGVKYDDHTDPLNPDTDGDSLLDGQEGPMGPYYGLDSLYNDTAGSGSDPAPLIFNGGYTHPLDADTDDDSWMQLYSGEIDKSLNQKLYPAGTEGQEYPMNDGNEVRGFTITLYDEDGEPYAKHVYTNPCNPDTDGDTGVSESQRTNPPAGAWLMSDGYELAQDPPSDPTNGDSDGDGLIDGLEGMLRQDSNHTFYLDPDTDDDGLPDMLDLLLGTDPLSADTDLDMVSDGDEFYKYGTDPTVADSDFDGLSDGEELFFWHTNPMMDDSDGDKLSDGYEVLVTGSNPMDEDSDNDGLTDFQEFFVYATDPFVYDTDGDGLSDGQEINLYNTDPLVWDTDHDSITEPNEYGQYTWPMSDYDEVMIYGTNATDADSDLDGLSDSIELYLGSGLIPWMDPIPLDPMDNDTDDDWLADGSELMLQNVSDITYPYVAVQPVLRFNSSPVLQDTDNDTLIDYQEICVFNTNPANNDTDGDGLGDWEETWVYNTSALYNDTDGDGLLDSEETLYEVYPYGAWPPTDWSIGMTTENESAETGLTSSAALASAVPAQTAIPGLYATSATDPDSDNDYLPDGSEVYFYHTDPTRFDSDGDGIGDGFEFDTDFDGLPDGLEFKLGTQLLLGGGIMNPDSDLDGLLDGDEYYVYGTDPTKTDTDGDGYSDGTEIAVGTDPLVFTSQDEFEMALAIARGTATMKILMPVAGSEVYQDTAISVVNFTAFQDMWFQYNNGSGWSDEYALEYNPAAQQWQETNFTWAPGNYTLRVFGRNATGIVHAQEISFRVIAGMTPFPWLLVGAAAGVIGLVAVVGIVAYKKGWFGKAGRKLGLGKDGKGGGDGSSDSKETKSSEKSKKTSTKKTTTSAKKSTRSSTTKKKGPSKGKKGGE
ncbi:MAG: hypothetical protein ACTSYL_12885 [Candidatus Thorarchaeota archaeon]